jgi:hypothetical protein
MEHSQMTQDELVAALRQIGVETSEARLDTLLPDARSTVEWLQEILALDVDGHEPSTRFRPGGR